MALFDAKARLKHTPAPCDNIAAIIQQRRYQILVHSLIYYELDTNLVSDGKWSEWATELVKLQTEYPDIANTVIFADAFKDFDGSTGFDLPYRDEQIVNIAYRLLRISDLDVRYALDTLRTLRTTPQEYKGDHYTAPERQPQVRTKVVKKNELTKRKKLF